MAGDGILADGSVAGACSHCHKVERIVGCDAEAFEAWRAGALIQVAMPAVSPEQRELLISGTCGNCWDRLFGGWDDED